MFNHTFDASDIAKDSTNKYIAEALSNTEKENILNTVSKLEDDAIINYNTLLEQAIAANDEEMVAILTEITDDERRHKGTIDAATANLLPEVDNFKIEGEEELEDILNTEIIEESKQVNEAANVSDEEIKSAIHEFVDALEYEIDCDWNTVEELYNNLGNYKIYDNAVVINVKGRPYLDFDTSNIDNDYFNNEIQLFADALATKFPDFVVKGRMGGYWGLDNAKDHVFLNRDKVFNLIYDKLNNDILRELNNLEDFHEYDIYDAVQNIFFNKIDLDDITENSEYWEVEPNFIQNLNDLAKDIDNKEAEMNNADYWQVEEAKIIPDFKIGDKVKQKSTGKTGYIVNINNKEMQPVCKVKFSDEEFETIKESELELVEESSLINEDDTVYRIKAKDKNGKWVTVDTTNDQNKATQIADKAKQLAGNDVKIFKPGEKDESLNEDTLIPENSFTKRDIDYIFNNIIEIGKKYGFKETSSEIFSNYKENDYIGISIENNNLALAATYYPSAPGFGDRLNITLRDKNNHYEDIDDFEATKRPYNNWSNDEILEEVETLLQKDYTNENLKRKNEGGGAGVAFNFEKQSSMANGYALEIDEETENEYIINAGPVELESYEDYGKAENGGRFIINKAEVIKKLKEFIARNKSNYILNDEPYTGKIEYDLSGFNGELNFMYSRGWTRANLTDTITVDNKYSCIEFILSAENGDYLDADFDKMSKEDKDIIFDTYGYYAHSNGVSICVDSFIYEPSEDVIYTYKRLDNYEDDEDFDESKNESLNRKNEAEGNWIVKIKDAEGWVDVTETDEADVAIGVYNYLKNANKPEILDIRLLEPGQEFIEESLDSKNKSINEADNDTIIDNIVDGLKDNYNCEVQNGIIICKDKDGNFIEITNTEDDWSELSMQVTHNKTGNTSEVVYYAFDDIASTIDFITAVFISELAILDLENDEQPKTIEVEESKNESESDLGLYIQTTGELYNKYISNKNKDQVNWDALITDGIKGYKKEIEDKDFTEEEKEEAKEYIKNYFFESVKTSKNEEKPFSKWEHFEPGVFPLSGRAIQLDISVEKDEQDDELNLNCLIFQNKEDNSKEFPYGFELNYFSATGNEYKETGYSTTVMEIVSKAMDAIYNSAAKLEVITALLEYSELWPTDEDEQFLQDFLPDTGLKNEEIDPSKLKIKEITRDEWKKTPKDYKMIKDGKRYIMYLDPDTHMTCLGLCKIVTDENETWDIDDVPKNETKFFKKELTSLPKKDAKFKVGDTVKFGSQKGKIVKVKPMKLSDTCTYQIRLDDGKLIWQYEEELNESLNENNWRGSESSYYVIGMDGFKEGPFDSYEEAEDFINGKVEDGADRDDFSIESEEDFEDDDFDESLNDNDKFNYMLLARLKQDCGYFLGNGNGYEPHLWAGNIEDQIAKMKEIYNKLPEKPEWLSLEDINNYEKEMLALKNKKVESLNEDTSSYDPSKDVDENGNPIKEYSDIIKYGGIYIRYNYKDKCLEKVYMGETDEYIEHGEVLTSIGLSLEEWLNAPNEYLYEFKQEVDEEMRWMFRDLGADFLNDFGECGGTVASLGVAPILPVGADLKAINKKLNKHTKITEMKYNVVNYATDEILGSYDNIDVAYKVKDIASKKDGPDLIIRMVDKGRVVGTGVSIPIGKENVIDDLLRDTGSDTDTPVLADDIDPAPTEVQGFPNGDFANRTKSTSKIAKDTKTDDIPIK